MYNSLGSDTLRRRQTPFYKILLDIAVASVLAAKDAHAFHQLHDVCVIRIPQSLAIYSSVDSGFDLGIKQRIKRQYREHFRNTTRLYQHRPSKQNDQSLKHTKQNQHRVVELDPDVRCHDRGMRVELGWQRRRYFLLVELDVAVVKKWVGSRRNFGCEMPQA
jgi:hypothetical protein